jgi:predicted transcriptional regulator
MLMPNRRKPADHKPKIIAPRLASGDSRIGIGHGLPPHIKEGLRAIAARENRSVSWVLEELIIDFFNLKRPTYIERKLTDEQKQEMAEQAARLKHRGKHKPS